MLQCNIRLAREQDVLYIFLFLVVVFLLRDRRIINAMRRFKIQWIYKKPVRFIERRQSWVSIFKGQRKSNLLN